MPGNGVCGRFFAKINIYYVDLMHKKRTKINKYSKKVLNGQWNPWVVGSPVCERNQSDSRWSLAFWKKNPKKLFNLAICNSWILGRNIRAVEFTSQARLTHDWLAYRSILQKQCINIIVSWFYYIYVGGEAQKCSCFAHFELIMWVVKDRSWLKISHF